MGFSRASIMLKVGIFFVIFFVGSTYAGGACETTDDCVAPNVCSKWGWCQWTKIYGEEGPSQGSSAPSGGRAGQCETSADCASRVPYCSALGYCHGGTLPFDEAQLEIEESVPGMDPEERPIGYINNNVRKNSPVFSDGNGNGGGNGNTKSNNQSQKRTGKIVSKGSRSNNRNSSKRNRNSANRKNQNRNNNKRNRPSNNNSRKKSQSNSGQKGCPGSLEDCVNDCVPLEKLAAYTACVRVCGKRCPE